MEHEELYRVRVTTKLLVQRTAENKRRTEHAVQWAKELRTTAAELRTELHDSIATARDLRATAKYERSLRHLSPGF